MRYRFEQLERRDLMVANIDIEGPSFVGKNEIVEYSIEVEILDFVTARATTLDLPLNDVIWTLDGEPIDTDNNSPAVEVVESGTLTATGRVPENLESFVLTVGLTQDTRSVIKQQLGFVVGDANTLGAEASWHDTNGRGVIFADHAMSLHSIENAGDVDGDGLVDLQIKHAAYSEDLEIVENQLAVQTFLGDRLINRRLPFTSDVVEPVESPRFIDINLDRDEFLIGDVDGDGFEDTLRTDPRWGDGIGQATILFGPDFTDNYVIVGTDRVDQLDQFIVYGGHAASLGDINGDGLGDFYVASNASFSFRIHVLHGRDFGREPEPLLAGDIDGDGNVAFADFTILSANFGRQDATRDEGDLDGDGQVSFTDFLILSKNFSQKT